MHSKSHFVFVLSAVLASLSVTACDLDVPDLNNPGLDELEDHPTAANINAACTGLLVGSRRNVAAENGLVVVLGILGREAYNFDTADPRYFGELLQGQLNQGSPFGGNFWPQPYVNLRLANVVLHAVDKIDPAELGGTAAVGEVQKSAIRGFVHTIQAMDLLEVIVTHDMNGAVIDTDQPIVQPPAIQPLGAIVDRTKTYNEIIRLLDAAVPELTAGGDAFPFPLSSGYPHDSNGVLKNSFDVPVGFIKLNRAIRARVAIYVQDYQGALDALAASFLDDTTMPIDFGHGVYHTFSTKAGDTTSALINPNIFAHPSVGASVEAGDKRYARKVMAVDPKDGGAGNGVSSTLRFSGLYPRPDSPVAVIRNEELILLKAEALWFTGKHD